MADMVSSGTQGESPRILLLAALGLLLLAPMVALSLSPWHVNSSLWYLGMLPVIIGLFHSPWLGMVAAFVTPVAMSISLLLRDYPIAGAAYMLVLGVLTGLSATRGWHLMASFAGPLAAYALIGDLHVTMPSG